MTDVSISRQGDFVRSGPEIADEVRLKIRKTFIQRPFEKIEIFNGEENILTMNQTHSKTFHCTYLLHYYPFDSQVNQACT